MKRGTIVILKPIDRYKLNKNGWSFPPNFIPQRSTLYTVRCWIAPDGSMPSANRHCIDDQKNGGIMLEELRNIPHPGTGMEVAWDATWWDVVSEPEETDY